MKRGLKELKEWCKEWAVEVNVEKSEVMPMRRIGVKKNGETFSVNDERIEVVEERKYLGCMVNDQRNCTRMMEEKVNVGAKALNDWMRRCRVTVDNKKVLTLGREDSEVPNLSGGGWERSNRGTSKAECLLTIR